MPLTPIGTGDKVLSKPLNDNFNYLDTRITGTNALLDATAASMQSNLSSAVTNIQNGYAKKDLLNVTGLTQVRIVTEAYKSGNSWYRIYDDKWCEQGSYSNAGAVTLAKNFADGAYTLIPANSSYSNKVATGFTLASASDWVAMGYLPDES